MVPTIKKKKRQNSYHQPLTLLEWVKFMLCIYTCICAYMCILGYICVFVCVHTNRKCQENWYFLYLVTILKCLSWPSQVSCMPSVFNVYLQNLIFLMLQVSIIIVVIVITYKTITVTLGFWDLAFMRNSGGTWQVVVLSLVQPSSFVG